MAKNQNGIQVKIDDASLRDAIVAGMTAEQLVKKFGTKLSTIQRRVMKLSYNDGKLYSIDGLFPEAARGRGNGHPTVRKDGSISINKGKLADLDFNQGDKFDVKIDKKKKSITLTLKV
jgi:hypothetical protein